MDRIDQLLDFIGERIPEVIWDRDAVDVDRPENWGAAELRSEPASQWADGRETDTMNGVELYLAVSDRESAWKSRVESALEAFDASVCWIDWHMDDRTWMPQIEKTLWRWTVRMLEGLDVPGADGAGGDDAGTDGEDARTDGDAGTDAEAGDDTGEAAG